MTKMFMCNPIHDNKHFKSCCYYQYFIAFNSKVIRKKLLLWGFFPFKRNKTCNNTDINHLPVLNLSQTEVSQLHNKARAFATSSQDDIVA